MDLARQSSYPIRKSQWRSFVIGVLASLISIAVGALVVGMFVAWPVLDGAVVIVVALACAGACFFGTVRAQRRLSRAWDARDPQIARSEAGLVVPGVTGPALPLATHTLAAYGRFVYRTHSGRTGVGSPSRSGSRQIFAELRTHTGSVVLFADDEGEGASLATVVHEWPVLPTPDAPMRLRLWARDLIVLVETFRRGGS